MKKNLLIIMLRCFLVTDLPTRVTSLPFVVTDLPFGVTDLLLYVTDLPFHRDKFTFYLEVNVENIEIQLLVFDSL